MGCRPPSRHRRRCRPELLRAGGQHLGRHLGKTGGAPLAAFTFNTLWSDAGTGTAVRHQQLRRPDGGLRPAGRPLHRRRLRLDRTSRTGRTTSASPSPRRANPVTGGWWLYAIRADDAGASVAPRLPEDGDLAGRALHDGQHVRLPDPGLRSATYQEVRVYAFNRSDLESGAALRSVVADLNSAAYFSLLPSNLRGAAPPAGRENLLVSESGYALRLRGVEVPRRLRRTRDRRSPARRTSVRPLTRRGCRRCRARATTSTRSRSG